MSAFSRFISGIANVVTPAVAIAPIDPGTKFIATQIGSEIGKSERQRKQASREINNMPGNYPTGIPNVGSQVSGLAPVSTANAGQGGFLSGITDFFSGAGDVVRSAFGSGIPQLLGIGRPRGAGQQPAITTVTNVGAQESQGSGSIQAGFGSLLPQIVGAARGLLKSPLGQIGIGTGAGAALSFIGSDGRPMRMTRKMKAQARQLLNMTGGNLSMTADFLGISEEALVALLLKRFRNDGPVVTKAALRKTKSTIRKLKNMCDMYDDLRPPSRRRTPMRRATRASTTLIKN
jgi:hypothetical protein